MSNIEQLISRLKSDYSNVRKDAAFELGKIADARAVEPLIEALRDDDDMCSMSIECQLKRPHKLHQ